MSTVVMPAVFAVGNVLRLPVVVEVATLAKRSKVGWVVVGSIAVEVGNSEDYFYRIVLIAGTEDEVIHGDLFFRSSNYDRGVAFRTLSTDAGFVGRAAPLAAPVGSFPNGPGYFSLVGRIILFVNWHGYPFFPVSNFVLPDSNSCQIVVPDGVTA